MLKKANFFYSQPCTLPKEALAKFYLSTTFGLSFMMMPVAPTQLSTFYALLITKIGNLNPIRPCLFSRSPGPGGGSEAQIPKIEVNINQLK